MSEFISYYEAYVWSSYWSKYFWPLAVIVLSWTLLIALIVYALTSEPHPKGWLTRKQKKWCSVVLLLGIGILLQDIFHAYRNIGHGEFKRVFAKSEKANRTEYPNRLYSAKGEMLDDKEILLKGYYSFDFPTSYLGASIQELVRGQYTYGGMFPFVVTGRTDDTFTVRVSPPDDFQSFSEEIVLSREESKAGGWYLFWNPYRETQGLWYYINREKSSSE